MPQRLSAKDKERLDEQRVIATLREEGLITRPMSRATGGLAFEVTADSTPAFARDTLLGARPSLPPLRLAKLEKRKKRRRKLTEEDIKSKLEKAEERRKVGRSTGCMIDLYAMIVCVAHQSQRCCTMNPWFYY